MARWWRARSNAASSTPRRSSWSSPPRASAARSASTARAWAASTAPARRPSAPRCATLSDQVWQCSAFMQRHVPGFEQAGFSGIATRVGVRETRRIVGHDSLSEDDVLSARKRDDGIAKGSHHVDIHQSGTGQIRIPVRDGGSYDIPWGCLLPQGVRNVVAAGRIFSSDRGANGSARVMGPCLAMGQAAGTAAALLLDSGAGVADFATLPVQALRSRLQADGAILDGTH
ncbi:FAD-dependent oxidoreductase [Hydrogenophaga sp. UC242_53]|uniref:FAD-dependent oxidoreductase n=1 Tax=Hydrogenophaga sp. UC242_53 TaxID=3350170 RepID=UPI0036D2A73F